MTDLLHHCNQVIKPLRKKNSCWDKVIVLYLIVAFFVCLLPGVLLAIFVHFAFIFVALVFYLAGLPLLLWLSR